MKSNSCKLIIIGEIVFLARACNAELSLTTVSETIFVTLDTTDIVLWDLVINNLKNCRTKDSCFHTVNRVIVKLSIQTWMLNDKCEWLGISTSKYTFIATGIRSIICHTIDTSNDEFVGSYPGL